MAMASGRPRARWANLTPG